LVTQYSNILVFQSSERIILLELTITLHINLNIGLTMPLVRIEIEKGYSLEYRKAILDGIHQALVETIKIPDHDRRQRIYELDTDHFEHTGRGKQYTIIEITMFKGRSNEAKKALYRRIVDLLGVNPGIPGSDITIIVNDPQLENWGIRGGYPASEVDLGFDIKV
jgi:phenylpyruvate tautomerase PptA (4-oxalocrotonate tautomerase family)